MNKFYYLTTLVCIVGLVLLAGCEDPTAKELDNIVAGDRPPVENCNIDHRTQTPGGWGAPAAGNNPGTIRDAHFDAVFPNGLVVGCAAGYSITLTSAQAVEDFLPSGGKPRVLDQDYVDPGKKDLKNTLASHIVALKLSSEMDHYLPDFGGAEYLLCDLILCEGKFAGKKVQQLLNQANKTLGGCPSNFTLEEAIDIISSINENFVDGEIDNGVLCCVIDEDYSNDDKEI